MTSAAVVRRAGPVLFCGVLATTAAACSDGGGTSATGTADVTSPSVTSPSILASSASPVSPPGPPSGAGTATTVDLDGDGAPDSLWLANVDGRRELGVATTAHGASSVEFASAAPQAASASGAVLASGAPTVFLDTGRSVQLYVYRVEDRTLVPVDGVDGEQYSFSLGFTGYGTGLTCRTQDDGAHLFGENATSGPQDVWTVERTEVDVSAEHSSATNGATTSVTGLGRDDPQVEAAHGTTCGNVPDSAIAREPV